MRARIAVVYALGLITACTAGAPARQNAGPQLSVKYAGHGQFSFESRIYSYNELLAKIRDTAGTVRVSSIDADMSGDATVGDMINACRLQYDTGIPVHAHYLNNGEQKSITCKQD